MAVPDPYLADPEELSVVVGLPADNPKLLFALRAASRRFRGAVGHPVTLVTDDVVTLDGNGRRTLLLPVWPSTAVTSVLLDGQQLTEGTDYSWSTTGVLRRLSAPWPDRLRAVQVTYSHGWATIPEDIQEVVLDQARIMHAVRPGVQAMQTGGQTITYGAQAAVGVTDQWQKAVARHRVRTAEDT